ncbi:NUDIX domain-containing protein [Jeotgalibacillus sp. S-D1]|uniref:NUDIX hydrolase n=1 Tax=Jeotgalibacillus sp. S-D1 TaxID=2552189 RepID=UPI0010598925|nr:NUDIX domain-containing protein [Jeotgalibacillus sp. S-D1]TDL30883.1 NUDIX domain-containing protein [Jeotgalibacillus sp. S-D1]
MRPRANTLGIVLRDRYVLLEEQNRKHSQGTGPNYRPIGGTIELGEKSSEALVREFKEEINADIEIDQYLACLENIFKLDDQIGHEITQLYAVSFKDERLYEKELFIVSEQGKETTAKWIDLEDVWRDSFVVYPTGLKDEIKKLIK